MAEHNHRPRGRGGPGADDVVLPALDSRFRGNDGTEAAAVVSALLRHWPEYLIEAAGLGVFMIVAGLCVVLLEYPASSLSQAIPSPDLRRAVIGIAMGVTAVAIVYSP